MINLLLASSCSAFKSVTKKNTKGKIDKYTKKGERGKDIPLDKKTSSINNDAEKDDFKNPISDFDYEFLNDGDVELEEQYKNSIKQNVPKNKYSSETDYNEKINEESPKSLKKDVFYNGKKGISMDLEKKIAKFLGESQIVQEDVALKAAQILFDWNKKTLLGKGKIKGRTIYAPPIINYKKDYFLTKFASYNSDTQKAYAKNIISPQKEGIVRAKKLKKTTEKYLYIEDGEFTTCRLENPHFSICTNKAKIIKDDRAITNIFYLKFEEFKTPIGFFYSVFKITEKRESGFLFPDIGLNSVKGFYLKDYGYFWALNEYMGLSIKSGFDSEYGDVYFKMPFEYSKRYSFKGKINTEWKNEDKRDIILFNWTHNTEQRPWGSFNSNISFKFEYPNPEYKSRFKELYEDNHTNADINFNLPNILSTPYNANISFHHDKKFGRKITSKTDELKTLEEKESEKDNHNIIFPNVSLKSKDFYIFRTFKKAPDFLSNLYFNHSIEFKYQKSKIINFNKFWNDLNNDFLKTLSRKSDTENNYSNTHYGLLHTIPITTNLTLFDNFIVTPNFTWKERWYLDKLDYSYDPTLKKVVITDINNEFRRIGEYNIGSTIQTNFEFRHFWDKSNFIQAFKHHVNPIVGIDFSPGYGLNEDECYKKVYNYYTKEIEKKYIYDDIYGSPQDKAKALLSFQLKNTIEFKYLNRKNKKSEIFQLFRSLDLSVGYDILAEKYRLQNIKIDASSSFWNNNINLKGNLEIDPYIYEKIDNEAEQIDDYAWNNGQFLGEIRNASFNTEINFKPKDQSTKTNVRPSPNRYVDFDIPWNMRISYNIAYHKESLIEISKRKLKEDRIKSLDPNKILKPHSKITSHTIHFDGGLNLTKKWKINFSILYNIKDDKFEQPKISLARDLHCWEMILDWTPLYYRNSFNFVIKVKANILKSIKYRSRGKL